MKLPTGVSEQDIKNLFNRTTAALRPILHHSPIRNDVEDIVNEALAKAVKNFIPGKSKFSTYFMNVVKTVKLDFTRRYCGRDYKEYGIVPNRPFLYGDPTRYPKIDRRGNYISINSNQRDIVAIKDEANHLLSKLRKRHRSVLVMRVMEEQTAQAISSTLKIGINDVRRIKNAAIEQLQRETGTNG